MSVTCCHRLEGFEPDNLLAFLALLGLLRTLEAADGELLPRASWTLDEPPLRPQLFLRKDLRQDEVAAVAAHGLDLLAVAHHFGGRRDLNYSRSECRTLLVKEATAASRANRRRVDLLAALMTDEAVKDKEVVDPTPLCLLSGQGHQHFLERLGAVPRQPAPRGLGKRAVSPEACIAEALFETWSREDATPSFRWDPEEDVRYALRAKDPTEAKGGKQHGANRLAAIGLAALPVVPEVRRGRVQSAILGGQYERDGFSFSFAWPVWRDPASLRAIVALLSHPRLRKHEGLSALGVDHVLVARRISVGRYLNFARARPI